MNKSIGLDVIINDDSISHFEKFKMLGFERWFVYPGEDADFNLVASAIVQYQRFNMMFLSRRRQQQNAEKLRYKSIITTILELLENRVIELDGIDVWYQNEHVFIKDSGGNLYSDSTEEDMLELIKYIKRTMYPGESFLITEDEQLLKNRIMTKLGLQQPKYFNNVPGPVALSVIQEAYVRHSDYYESLPKVELADMPQDVINQIQRVDVSVLLGDVISVLPVTSPIHVHTIDVKKAIYRDSSKIRNVSEPDKYYGIEYKAALYEGKDIYICKKWIKVMRILFAQYGDSIIIDKPDIGLMSVYYDIGFRLFGSVSQGQRERLQSKFKRELVFCDNLLEGIIVRDGMNRAHVSNTWDIPDVSPEILINEYGLDYNDRVISVVWGSFEKDAVRVKYKRCRLLHLGYHKAVFIAFPMRFNVPHEWLVDEYIIRTDVYEASVGSDDQGHPIKMRSYMDVSIFCLMASVLRNIAIFSRQPLYMDNLNKSISPVSMKDFFLVIKKYRIEYEDSVLIALLKHVMFRMTTLAYEDYSEVRVPLLYSRGAYKYNGAPRVITEEPIGRLPYTQLELEAAKGYGAKKPNDVRVYSYNLNNSGEVFNARHLRKGFIYSEENDVRIFKFKQIDRVQRSTVGEVVRDKLAHNSMYGEDKPKVKVKFGGFE